MCTANCFFQMADRVHGFHDQSLQLAFEVSELPLAALKATLHTRLVSQQRLIADISRIPLPLYSE